VILIPNVVHAQQVLLFGAAIESLAEIENLTNKVLEIDIAGNEITLQVCYFPPVRDWWVFSARWTD
jgi:hypothetical protein